MKIIITESQLNGAYWKYLKYLLGNLTEVQSDKYPTYRFWKNDEYGVVLELRKSGNLWVHSEIWTNFSEFFSLQYNETQQVMKSLLEEHLKLGGITPEIRLPVGFKYWKNI
jgi:hypothetical protein